MPSADDDDAGFFAKNEATLGCFSLSSLIGVAAVDLPMDLTKLEGATPLFMACQYGHIECARLLLKAKAMVDLRDAEICSALYKACGFGQLECARLLLESKATVDLPAKCGATPLMIAAENGHAPVVQLLLEAKASTTLRGGRRDLTALEAAWAVGNAACVALLEPVTPEPPESAPGQKLLQAATSCS